MQAQSPVIHKGDSAQRWEPSVPPDAWPRSPCMVGGDIPAVTLPPVTPPPREGTGWPSCSLHGESG